MAKAARKESKSLPSSFECRAVGSTWPERAKRLPPRDVNQAGSGSGKFYEHCPVLCTLELHIAKPTGTLVSVLYLTKLRACDEAFGAMEGHV